MAKFTDSDIYKTWQNRFVKTIVSILPAVTVCSVVYNIFNNYAIGFNVFQIIVSVCIVLILFLPFTFFSDYIDVFRRIFGDNLPAVIIAGVVAGIFSTAGCGLSTWIPEKIMYNNVDYEFVQHYEQDCGVTFDTQTGSIHIDSDIAGSYEEAQKIEENLKSDILAIEDMRPTFMKKFIKPLPAVLIISIVLIMVMTTVTDCIRFSI